MSLTARDLFRPRSRVVRSCSAVIVLAAVFLAVSPDLARGNEIIGSILSVRVSNGTESGEFLVPYDPALFNPVTETYRWTLGGPVDILSGSGRTLATLTQAESFLDLDPQVGLNFTLVAGSSGVDVTITSAQISFSPISPAEGRASAGMTATDLNGDGVTIMARLAGGTKSYQAQYNGAIPGGQTFATLVNSIAAGPFGIGVSIEEFPLGGGFAPIGQAVADMQTQFSFNLSGHDASSGTSVFVVVPEPATLGALGLGCLVLLRRRSSRR